jgi:futalosine hydrolase
MQVLLVCSTTGELEGLAAWLGAIPPYVNGQQGQFKNITFEFLITGVGMIAPTFYLTQRLSQNKPDLVIHFGIAGAYPLDWPLGKTVMVVSEQLADTGAEDKDGAFLSLEALGLLDPDLPPFKRGLLINDAASEFEFLPKAAGLTVAKVQGYEPHIKVLKETYPDAQVESMEGAAIFYTCLQLEQPFLSIRSISNHVTERNRASWDIPGALQQLHYTLYHMLDSLTSDQP